MKFSLLIDDRHIAIGGQDPDAVFTITGDMGDVAVLKLWVLGGKVAFYRFAIEHIQSVTCTDPEIPIEIGTHIYHPQIREAMACVEMPERDIALALCSQAAVHHEEI